MNLDGTEPLTLRDVLSLALRHLEVVAGRLEECKDAEHVVQVPALFVAKEKDELSVSVSSSKDLGGELLVAKESSNADVVAMGFELELFKEPLTAIYIGFEELLVTVGVKSSPSSPSRTV